MHAVKKLIDEYKRLLAEIEGEQAARAIEVDWPGGTNVVIRENGRGRLVDLGTFRAMVARLRERRLPKAA